jgi:hypothetical protein
MFVLASNAFAVVDFEVNLFNNNEREVKAEKLLEKLNQTHDLELISFTKKIQIKSREIAHSHPVLTLNTRYIDNEVAFFSVFIHEQIHWHLSKPEYKESFEKFIVEVKKQYPNIPVGRVDGGARTEHSSYLHLAVIFLEFDMLSFYIGQEDAQEWMLKNTIYSSLNKMIIRDYKYFEKLISRLNLHVL